MLQKNIMAVLVLLSVVPSAVPGANDTAKRMAANGAGV